MSIQRKPEILPVSSLSLGGQYRQVKSYATIGRALNPHYATRPEAQGTRWHIWFDGKDVASMVCSGKGSKSAWEEGPSVTPSDIASGDGIVAGLGTLLASKKGGVGVIFHSADCSVLNYVKETYDSVDKLGVVQALSVENPAGIILGDVQSVADGHRWRPMAVPGAAKGRFALFRLSNRDMTGAVKLGQLDGNFSVAVRSAHMEALAVGQGMAGLLDADNAPAGEFGRILVYYYRRSTMVAVYNPQGLLSELRLLPQSEGGCPQTLRNDFSLILQKAPSSEMLVTVFQCAGGIEALVEELGSAKSVAGVNVSLQVLERGVFPEFCQSAGLPLRRTGEFLPMEFAIEYPEWLVGHGIGGKNDEATAIALATADFSQNSAEAAQSIPTPADLKFFILGKLFRLLAAVAILAGTGWASWSAWKMYRSEEWGVDMKEVQDTAGKVAELRSQKTLADEYQAAIKPKPDGAYAMELVLALFPAGDELSLSNLSVEFGKEDGGMGGTGMGGGDVLRMRFEGSATQRGIALLNRLRNQQYLSSIIQNANQAFRLEQGATGEPKFSFSERRTAATQDNSRYSYDFSGTFDLPLGGGMIGSGGGASIDGGPVQ